MWWKRNRTKRAKEGNDLVDVFAQRILIGYRNVKGFWVRLMERIVSGWSVRKQKSAFLLISILVGLYCAGLLYRGLTEHGTGAVVIEEIKTGDHIGKTRINDTLSVRVKKIK